MRRFILVLCLLLPLPATAQNLDERPAVLVADDLLITRDRVLIARGNVEAFQGDTRIRAKSISYDEQTGALTIEGPIVLTDGAGSVILADAAELDSSLQNGLLTGARMVMNQQVQLAAVQIDRVDGRYSQLYKTAVTSCKICEDGEVPLWQIRARRVIHDEVGQQLYFDDATFHIKNVPVFHLPRLRMPDPTLDRATGFLTPSIRTTSQLGTGLKLPYFIKLGDSRDLTLAPYLSTATRTLEFRYRQAFVGGNISFEGAYTRDDEIPDTNRGYLDWQGAFDLRRDYKLSFNIKIVSDEAYFTEYGYLDEDRLRSDITVSRARRDSYVRASLYNFETLRDGEINSTLPTLVIDGEFERRFFPKSVGGEVRFSLEAHSHQRSSTVDVIGRDVARINGKLEYLRRFTHKSGLVTDARAGLGFNAFDITQDTTYSQNHTDLVPSASVGLSYPMVRRGAGGVTQMLTPLAQVGWTGGERLDIPNEESTRVEFDQGNLLSLSRFPSSDRQERGTVTAVGMNWSRFDPQGWDTHIAVGQVFRSVLDSDFTNSSGLSGTKSNILLAGQIRNHAGLSLTARTLFDNNFEVSKTELRGDLGFRNVTLGGTYVWLEADAAEDRTEPVSEISLDGSYDFRNHWTASADVRYDVDNDRAATAGLGLTYNNECVSVDLSVRRRYTSSTSVEPSTDIGFNIGLRGFSASNGKERYVRSCGM
ncbi:LPS-assembly protein LptD [Sulfitobacter sp. CW3]|uniref:LPS-assembly protein LptD n=1 Tax=Sulfitobacter sp. CW3 TaxID=2861965 RepID=UPI001C5E13BA|nr:LPS assembly protein LptD [Sulfitobacter sp. CW3]MBW4960941.1 LPS assembly protein LptD [Sulfitobacter sp. CW3]